MTETERPRGLDAGASRPAWTITTAIPYVNAPPHIGFALEMVQADVLARYRRAEGYDVHFQAGSDENSLKNVQAAEAEEPALAERASLERAVLLEEALERVARRAHERPAAAESSRAAPSGAPSRGRTRPASSRIPIAPSQTSNSGAGRNPRAARR